MSQNEEVVRNLIAGSPYGALLGFELEQFEPDRVVLRLPFRPEVVTIGDLVHGGAISSLIDAAATGAFWSTVDLAGNPRGTTIGFNVSFLSGARGKDAIAEARVIQRGKTISVADVAVRDGDGRAVARALVTYKLG